MTPGVSATRNGACWGWVPTAAAVSYADASGSTSIPTPSGQLVDTVTPDPYDDSGWLVDATGAKVFHLAASTGTVLSQFALPAAIGRVTPDGLYRFLVTRACDPALQGGSAACRELYMADTADPGTVYRLDGNGNLVSSFKLAAGVAGFLDVR